MRRIFLGYRKLVSAVLVLCVLGTVIGVSVVSGAPSVAELTDVDALVFSNPGQNNSRDIRTTGGAGDNLGGIRIFADGALTNPPTTAALQFFGIGHTVFPGQAFIDSGSHSNAAILFRTAASGGVAERMRVAANGNVGIGTANPQSLLNVGSNTSDLLPSANVMRVGNNNPESLAVIGNVSAVNLNMYLHGFTIRKALFQAITGGTQGGSLGFYVKPDCALCDVEEVIRVTHLRNVGIGTNNPTTKLTVKGTGTGSGQVFRIENGSGDHKFSVTESGIVTVGGLTTPATTAGVCVTPGFTLAECSSAAEYVPTVDAGRGFPEVSDLVSMNAAARSPYGDEHAPFAVAKSATSCDPSLMGFLLAPELGADGKKLNEYYQPLAMYGYFPAKVTMEGGAIRRGDPITSSSTPGAGMKATGACRTIGYALDDAEQDGLIQVFASLGDSSAGQVAALEARVKGLEQQLQAADGRQTVSAVITDERVEASALREQNVSLQAQVSSLQERNLAQQSQISGLQDRLERIEQSAERPDQLSMLPVPNGVFAFVGLGLIVIVAAVSVRRRTGTHSEE